ncbi:hypothetical protein, partial [Staphylococcus aureus]
MAGAERNETTYGCKQHDERQDPKIITAQADRAVMVCPTPQPEASDDVSRALFSFLQTRAGKGH